MGALFLAAKIEERFRYNLIRDFMRVFHYMHNERNGRQQTLLELGGERYTRWKRMLLRTERTILKELGFNVYSITEHPHKFILYYLNALKSTSDADRTKKLAQTSWNCLNDSLRLDLCVRYDAQTIACAAIHISAQTLKIALPNNPPWWELFEASKEHMDEIRSAMRSLYASPKMTWMASLKTATVSALTPGLNERGHSAPAKETETKIVTNEKKISNDVIPSSSTTSQPDRQRTVAASVSKSENKRPREDDKKSEQSGDSRTSLREEKRARTTDRSPDHARSDRKQNRSRHHRRRRRSRSRSRDRYRRRRRSRSRSPRHRRDRHRRR